MRGLKKQQQSSAHGGLNRDCLESLFPFSCKSCIDQASTFRKQAMQFAGIIKSWNDAYGYLIAAFIGHVPGLVALLYVVASIAAFLAYAIDKSAATSGARRIPENTLLLLGLAGGWPGAIVAQQMLRHKSIKQPFRSAFWGTVILNVLAFLLLGSRYWKAVFPA
jgi:uncharacterized membrane protein YsdA (DUF1294 family)